MSQTWKGFNRLTPVDMAPKEFLGRLDLKPVEPEEVGLGEALQVPSKPGTFHPVRVKLSGKGGISAATPVRRGGTGILSLLTRFDGLLIVPQMLRDTRRATWWTWS